MIHLRFCTLFLLCLYGPHQLAGLGPGVGGAPAVGQVEAHTHQEKDLLLTVILPSSSLTWSPMLAQAGSLAPWLPGSLVPWSPGPWLPSCLAPGT